MSENQLLINADVAVPDDGCWHCVEVRHHEGKSQMWIDGAETAPKEQVVVFSEDFEAGNFGNWTNIRFYARRNGGTAAFIDDVTVSSEYLGKDVLKSFEVKPDPDGRILGILETMDWEENNCSIDA